MEGIPGDRLSRRRGPLAGAVSAGASMGEGTRGVRLSRRLGLPVAQLAARRMVGHGTAVRHTCVEQLPRVLYGTEDT